MNKRAMGWLMGAVLIAGLGLGLGYFFWPDSRSNIGYVQQKPVINAANAEIRIDVDTPLVLEKEYTYSQKVIISEFIDRQDIIGSTLDEIRNKYTIANGFAVTFKEGSLVIRQTINDWAPEDKAKCRLKEYQGMVAIYQGPDRDNDSLLRVTAIIITALPADISAGIQQGQYEFQNQAELNDFLENLDEYL